ncbi:MAG: transposase, partial [Promethearchaeota archaeon]
NSFERGDRKTSKNRRNAKKKSRVRSKVESTFGILHKNHNFGQTLVRGMNNVKIDTCLKVTSWNHFFLISYLMNRFEDCISLRKLFYEN